jgi:hypothetical protein
VKKKGDVKRNMQIRNEIGPGNGDGEWDNDYYGDDGEPDD